MDERIRRIQVKQKRTLHNDHRLYAGTHMCIEFCVFYVQKILVSVPCL